MPLVDIERYLGFPPPRFTFRSKPCTLIVAHRDKLKVLIERFALGDTGLILTCYQHTTWTVSDKYISGDLSPKLEGALISFYEKCPPVSSSYKEAGDLLQV